MYASTFDLMMLLSYGAESCLSMLTTAFVMLLMTITLLLGLAGVLMAVAVISAGYSVLRKSFLSGMTLFVVMLAAVTGAFLSLLIAGVLQSMHWEHQDLLVAASPGAVTGAVLGWGLTFCARRAWDQAIHWCSTKVTWMDGDPTASRVDGGSNITHDYL